MSQANHKISLHAMTRDIWWTVLHRISSNGITKRSIFKHDFFPRFGIVQKLFWDTLGSKVIKFITLNKNIVNDCVYIPTQLVYIGPSYINTLSNLWYKAHLSWQLNCWSLRCSWSTTCWRCSKYIFIPDLTPGFNRLGKDNCKIKRETFKFWDLMFTLDVWQ